MTRPEAKQFALLLLGAVLCALAVAVRVHLCEGLRCVWVAIP